QAVGRLHRNRTHAVLAEVLLDLRHNVDRAGGGALGLDAERVVDFRQMTRLELDVDDGADDLHDRSDLLCLCSHNRISVRDSGFGIWDSRSHCHAATNTGTPQPQRIPDHESQRIPNPESRRIPNPKSTIPVLTPL